MAQYPDWEVGDLVTADLLDAMVHKVYNKANATSRNTTTTYADDPDLLNIPVGVGTWEIELVGFFNFSNATNGGLKTRWGFSGTWNNPLRNCMGPGSTNTGGTSVVTPVTLSAAGASTQDAIYLGSSTSAYYAFREVSFNAVVTVAGNLSLSWAQNSSSANNTIVHENSGFKLRQVAA